MIEDTNPLENLLGRTIVSIQGTTGSDEITFLLDDGGSLRMYHWIACCEGPAYCDICGDLNDLIGSPILQAEEALSAETVPADDEDDDWEIWAFYKFATIKGSVTIQWDGIDNIYSSQITCEFKKAE